MKNLVVFHLESLSNYIYHVEKERMPALNEMMNKATSFTHFFSSATSSLMAITDFLYGNDFELDQIDKFERLQPPMGNQSNLFDLLSDHGYEVLGIGYPQVYKDDLNEFKLWSKRSNQFKWVNNYEEFKTKIKEFLMTPTSKPKALYVWDLLSHLYYLNGFKLQGTNFHERRSYGYEGIDRTIQFTLEVLNVASLAEETIVVGFGDHGDELWTHGLNQGFCHGFEPYTSISWTPAFIYEPGQMPEVNNKLVSLIDLRSTILHLLDIEEVDSFPYSGINIYQDSNEYIYSRNFFANQIDSKYETSEINKSYSIINANFNLIVTKYGMELYEYHLDPTNHCNLLNFFDIDEQGAIKFNPRGATHIHFRRSFFSGQIDFIEENYYKLRKKLLERIRIKNNFITAFPRHPFDESNMLRIREKKYRW